MFGVAVGWTVPFMVVVLGLAVLMREKPLSAQMRRSRRGRRRCRNTEPVKFMMLFWVDEAGEATAAESAALTAAVASWVEMMTQRGVLVDSGPLVAGRDGRMGRVRDGEVLVSDGPYAETKEQIGGYGVIECAGLEEAVELAAGHPLARSAAVEVRAFWLGG